MTYDNPATVVVTMVEVNQGLLMVRRGLKDGYGQLALPGGYQVKGETWQGAAVREVFEETGLELDRSLINLLTVKTVEQGINLFFCHYTKPLRVSVEGRWPLKTDDETLEVVIAGNPVECAFPTHTEAVRQFFNRNYFRFAV